MLPDSHLLVARILDCILGTLIGCHFSPRALREPVSTDNKNSLAESIKQAENRSDVKESSQMSKNKSDGRRMSQTPKNKSDGRRMSQMEEGWKGRRIFHRPPCFLQVSLSLDVTCWSLSLKQGLCHASLFNSFFGTFSSHNTTVLQVKCTSSKMYFR